MRGRKNRILKRERPPVNEGSFHEVALGVIRSEGLFKINRFRHFIHNKSRRELRLQGFRKRMSTAGGRKTISRRRAKGRARLSV